MPRLPTSPLKVTEAAPRHQQGAVSRADLLEALQRQPLDWFALPAADASSADGAHGYVLEVREFQLPDIQLPLLPKRPPPDAMRQKRAPLQVPRLWAVVKDETLPTDDEGQAIEPVPLHVELPHRPSVADSKAAVANILATGNTSAWPRLKTELRQLFNPPDAWQHRSPVDWRAATHRMARGRALAPLPRRSAQRWPANLVLALDRNADSLTPFVNDMDTLAHQVRRAIGHRSVQVRVLSHDPRAATAGWWADQKPGTQALRPLFGGWMLLVSDLGAAPADAVRHAEFQTMLRFLIHGGTRVAALAPLPRNMTALPKPAVALPWGSASTNGSSDSSATFQPPGCADVLALVALTGAVSDLLLRALVNLVSPGNVNRALMWAVWNHPHMQTSGRLAQLLDAHRKQHEAHLAKLPAPLLQSAYATRQSLHAEMPWADEHLSALRACELAPQLAQQLQPALASAQQYLRSELLRNLKTDTGESRELAIEAAMLIAVAHPEVRSRYARQFERLQSHAHEAALRRGEAVPSYTELRPASLPDAGNKQAPPATHWQLVQEGASLMLSAYSAARRRALIVYRLEAASSDGVTVKRDGTSRWLSTNSGEVCIAQLDEVAGSLEIQLRQQLVEVAAINRPSWALGWQQDDLGLRVSFVTPWGTTKEMSWPQYENQHVAKDADDPKIPHLFGTDKFGLLLLLEINGVNQTFRYIEPGSFQMGSADSDQDNERPVHQVTITQGYWLADTPCTQALWMAVMGGKNPSHFSDQDDSPQRPVEEVSWDTVQTFLDRLQSLLPSACKAALPTEAEWEYAARAGTQTAYWWGNDAETAKANMDGSRKGTTSVKTYDANDWGLYDVHGNVWEWCADAKRTYRDEAEINPSGGSAGDRRVVRGGSWGYSAGDARSAARLVNHRANDWYYLGFRLALRSPGPDGGAVVLAGQRPAPAAGSSRTPAEPGFFKTVFERIKKTKK